MFDRIIEAVEKLEKRGIDPSKILVGLTGVERSILNVLMEYEQAMNPNQIRHALILDVLGFLMYLMGKGKARNELKYWRGEFHYPVDEKAFFKEWKNIDAKTQNEMLEKTAKLLKKHRIANIPDYRTVERILIELEAFGIVASRDESGKAKKVYFVNPVLLTRLRRGNRKKV